MTFARFMSFLALRVSLIVMAFRTWRGSSLARYGLVVLVILSYGWDAYWRYTRVVTNAEPVGILAASWARVVTSVAIGGAIVGYLLFSRKAHEYFRIRHEDVAQK